MQAATTVSQRSATAASGNPVTILAFSGDIASTSQDALMEAYKGLDRTVYDVLLDFKGADYINSSGIAIIIEMLMKASKTAEHAIGLFGLTPHFNKVFTMVGVSKYATMSPDEATALAAL